jgi:hypothetical protein
MITYQGQILELYGNGEVGSSIRIDELEPVPAGMEPQDAKRNNSEIASSRIGCLLPVEHPQARVCSAGTR